MKESLFPLINLSFYKVLRKIKKKNLKAVQNGNVHLKKSGVFPQRRGPLRVKSNSLGYLLFTKSYESMKTTIKTKLIALKLKKK